MANIFARQRQLIGTTADWAANDIVLGNGEIGAERVGSLSTKFKCGNGVAKWSELPYVDDASATVSDLVSYKALLDAQVFTYYPTKNLYNPAAKRTGKYVLTGGTIGSATGWDCTEFIPVTPGETIHINSNTTRHGGLSFFTSASDSAYVGSGVNNTTGTSLVVTVPAGANFMVATVKSTTNPEPTQLMINRGNLALPYEAWHVPYPFVKESAVANDPSVYPQYVTRFTSANLYVADNRQSGKYVVTGGTIASAAGWECTEFIPVTPGEKIFINSNTTRQGGLSFFTSASDSAYVGSGVNMTTGKSLLVTVPAGAAFMVATVKSPTYPEPTELMINRGSAALPYDVGGEVDRIKASAITPRLTVNQISSNVLLSSDASVGSTSIAAGASGDTVKWTVSPRLPVSRSSSNVFQLVSLFFNGEEQFTETFSDDVAPIHAYNWTIGANHGWAAMACTVTGHGKTTADIGSVWSDGANQYVIVSVPSVNSIWLTRRADNNQFTSGTFTHVSGATNTATFTPSAFSFVQWYPTIKNRALSYYVDETKVSTLDTTYYPRRSVTFAERYEVMNKNSIVEWMIANPPGASVATDGTSDIEIANTYTYDTFGGLTISGEIRAINAVSSFADIMFLQSWKLGAIGGPLKWLIPDTKSFVHEGTTHDFSKVYDMTGWSKTATMTFNSSTYADTSILPDRLVQLNGRIGLAMGFVPIRDADPSTRPTLASRKACTISTAGKFYFYAIDSASRTSLAAGDCFSFVGYRVAFALNANRTAGYVVRAPGADWLFLDWHASIRDTFELPADLQGRAFTVHRKTSGVTVRSRFAADALVFDVTTSGGAGQYAILRFDRQGA